MTKKCFKCGEILSLDMFYKHAGMADGRINKCKDCTKKDVRENRSANIDYYLEYDRTRSLNPNRVQARKKYQQTEKGRLASNKAKIKWSLSNAIKRRASHIVNNAIRDGILIKPISCSYCGNSGVRIHGHHDDYAFPMIVRWLCSKCHRAWHKEHGEAING